MQKSQSILPDDNKQNLRLVTGSEGINGKPVIINVNEFDKAKTLLLSNVDINYEGASGSINFDINGDPKSKFIIWGIRNSEYTEISHIGK